MKPVEQLHAALSDMFWAPNDATLVDRPELQYVTCARPEAYLNQCTRLRGDAVETDSLIAEVDVAHRTRASRIVATDSSDDAVLRQALERSKYDECDLHDACVFDVSKMEEPSSSSFTVERVSTIASLRDSVRVIDAAFERTTQTNDAEEQTYLEACRAPGGRVHRVVAYEAATGEPVSMGGMNLYPDIGIGLLWGGSTVPAARGRGAYNAVLRARMSIAARLGIGWVGLYALRTTSSPIVRALGFEKVGTMTNWQRP